MTRSFPQQQDGLRYLTEGGQETEIMYKFGFELPEFAMFPLLDDPRAVVELRRMYERFLETACAHGFGALMGGFDYRASPDWAGLLGYSPTALEEMQLRAIEFLREVAAPYVDQLPALMFVGIVGPRGDAYSLDHPMTAEEAEDGPTLKEAIEAVDAECGDDRPAFYGINCSHPLEFLPAIEPGDWFERVRCLRPNAAMMDKISLCTLGHLEAGDPVDLGQRMGAIAEQFPHLDIWGGCCGTWDTHLDEIARNVKTH